MQEFQYMEHSNSRTFQGLSRTSQGPYEPWYHLLVEFILQFHGFFFYCILCFVHACVCLCVWAFAWSQCSTLLRNTVV